MRKVMREEGKSGMRLDAVHNEIIEAKSRVCTAPGPAHHRNAALGICVSVLHRLGFWQPCKTEEKYMVPGDGMSFCSGPNPVN